MKSLEEKRLLAKMARNIGQPDLALEESIRREEELNQKLFTKHEIVQEEKVLVQELVTDPRSASGKSIAPVPAAEPMGKLPEPPKVVVDLHRAELQGLRKQITEINQRIGTLAFGGGGTGAVRFDKLDDHEYPSGVKALIFNTSGPDYAPPGSIAWNPNEECLDVYQPDGTILQAGLESYIRVHNHTGSVIPQGTFVMFSGVSEPDPGHADHAPTVVPYLADANYPPLYTVGVMTEDLANNDTGRATTFGKVRGLDTTGAAVSETWQMGDLLWAHPTIPGALTRVQPTAPYLAVSVAAVLHVDAVNGILLVRPSIFPRLHYGSFYDSTNQTAAQANTAYAVKFNTTGIGCGHVQIDAGNTANVVAVHQGLYNFDFQLQVTSTNSSRGNIWIWARKNGTDIPRSATKLSIESNGGVIAPSWSFRLSMAANDVFQLMWAVDSTNISLQAPAATAFCPETPSATLQVTQVNL